MGMLVSTGDLFHPLGIGGSAVNLKANGSLPRSVREMRIQIDFEDLMEFYLPSQGFLPRRVEAQDDLCCRLESLVTKRAHVGVVGIFCFVDSDVRSSFRSLFKGTIGDKESLTH